MDNLEGPESAPQSKVHARGVCEKCGPFRILATEVTVRQCLNNGEWSYRCRCPDCTMPITKQVQPRVALQLLLNKAPFEPWNIPREKATVGDGEILGFDDLLAFHDNIQNNDTWSNAFSRLVEETDISDIT